MLLAVTIGNSARLDFMFGKLILAILCATMVVYCRHELLRMWRYHAAIRSEVITGVKQVLVLCDGRPIKTTVYRNGVEYHVEVGRKPKRPHMLAVKIREEQRMQNLETGYDDSVVYNRVYEIHTRLHTVRYGMDVTYHRVTAGNLQQIRMTVADEPEEEQSELGNIVYHDILLERLNAAYNTVSSKDLKQLAELLAAPAV